MTGYADLLWHVNNEYRKRLSSAEKYAELLEQLVLAREQTVHALLLDVLRYVREQIHALTQEHRDWRHHYYYDPNDHKRMVQSDAEIDQALAHFEEMRQPHILVITEITRALNSVQRPDTNLTHVAGGDLWLLLIQAINDLVGFIEEPDR
jgi:hypothetical protein